MAPKIPSSPATPAARGRESAAARKERLAAELRSNLAKRKAQARARAGGSSPPDGVGCQEEPGRPGEQIRPDDAGS